jgi:FAD/FMN-containing dehydrogenase
VISLDRMRGVSVNSKAQIVRVQGVALWDDVNRATASQTGVGGSTLGRGYGWLTGRYGLIVDSLVRATVMLANGSVLEASDEAHRTSSRRSVVQARHLAW